MDLGFAEILLLVGVLLVVTSGLSGWLHGNVLSISVLSVTAGVVLAATGVVDVSPEDEGLVEVVELALILTLFTDGLIVDHELLRRHWGPPARALVVAMPITLVLIALAAAALFGELSWGEAFLLGAVLAPTDPVITSSVVSSPRVPERIRHTLNIESGLNDGLALPFVLVLIVVSESAGDAGGATLTLAGESAAGAVIGAALGVAGAAVLKRLPGGGLLARYEGVYALGVALLAYGVADATVGNGLVSAFLAGIALGLRAPDAPEAFAGFNENLGSVLQVVTFLLFGALVVTTGYDSSVWALAAFVVAVLLVARPAAVLLSFLRSSVPGPQRLFVAWFGPKGVASMLFALFVLHSQAPDRTIVFDVASFVILASIAAHGLTDTVGARWVERRLERTGPEPAGTS